MAAQPTEQPQSLEDEWRTLSDDEQYERMHNAASFVDIPMEQIPGDKMMRHAIKLALKLRALSGHDCYAYRPANQREYVIWDRQPDPATESRFTPRAWAIRNGFGHLSEDDKDATECTGFVYYDKDGNAVEPEPFVFDDNWDEDDTNGKEGA